MCDDSESKHAIEKRTYLRAVLLAFGAIYMLWKQFFLTQKTFNFIAAGKHSEIRLGDFVVFTSDVQLHQCQQYKFASMHPSKYS